MISRSAWAYLPMLPYHLSQAGRVEKLRELLLRFDWIEEQVRRSNIVGAVADCDFLPDSQEVQTLGRALLLSRDALASDPDQLAFQLHGRLAESPENSIATLLEEARHATSEQMWLQPMTASLQRPDAGLRWTIRASQSSIDTLVVLGDGGFACATAGEVQIWKAGLEQTDTTLGLPGAGITHLACVADSQLLSGADDGSIHLWDPESARKIRSFTGHSAAITVLAVHGETFVSAASDGSLLGWHLNESEPRRKFRGHEKEVSDVAFLDRKCFASVAGDRKLRLWSFATGKQVRSAQFRTFPGEKIASWKPRHLLAATFAGEVYGWKIAKKSLKQAKYFRYKSVGHSSFVLLRKDLGVSGGGGARGIRTWNPQAGKAGAEVYVPGGDVSCCVRADEASVLCGTKDGYVSRVEVPSVSADSGQGEDVAPVYNVATINDEYAASTAGGGRVRLWNPNSGTEIGTLQGNDKIVSSVSILREDKLAAVEMGSSQINLWNPLTGERISSIETSKEILLLHAFSPGILVTAPSVADRGRPKNEEGQSIDIWDVDRRKRMTSLPIRYMVATMLSISGRFLILGTYNSPILHLDISTYSDRRNFKLEGHTKGVVSLAALDSGLLASGSLDTSIRFWDLERQECVGVLSGHEKEVTGLAPLTNRYLASASLDQTIRIWDLETRYQIHRVDCDAGLNCIATTPDRQSLLAGDERGQVHFLRIVNLGLQRG